MSSLHISFDIKVNSIVVILMEKINQLNETMQCMQNNMDNYIASNDFELKAINDTYYAVKTPLVIAVPSSDEIDDHRSEVSKCNVVA